MRSIRLCSVVPALHARCVVSEGGAQIRNASILVGVIQVERAESLPETIFAQLVAQVDKQPFAERVVEGMASWNVRFFQSGSRRQCARIVVRP